MKPARPFALACLPALLAPFKAGFVDAVTLLPALLRPRPPARMM